jgi:hypothetical protein
MYSTDQTMSYALAQRQESNAFFKKSRISLDSSNNQYNSSVNIPNNILQHKLAF